MIEWILTSSLLIAAVLLIRFVGRDRLSARVRYALWALVLLRLLLPGSFGATALSVLNYVPETTAVRDTVSEPQRDHQQVQTPQQSDLSAVSENNDTFDMTMPSDTLQTTQTVEPIQPSESTVQEETIAQSENSVATPNISMILWAAGMLLVGGVFVLSNVRFAALLRRSRVYLFTDSLPVYETAAIETPCLFGFLRPAVYVTPDVFGDENALRHILAHELTHYRHKDHIWSFLRCLCLTVHWFNPLVWLAAYVSQQDAELACDEGALKRIGDDERTSYARTLLDLTCVGHKELLTMATSMTGSENTLKTRILRIVKNPQMPKIAIPIVFAFVVVIGLVMFTGKQTDPMEGIWRGESLSDRRPYPEFTRVTIVSELEFRDGKVRLTVTEDGVFTWGRDYESYTMEDGKLQLNIEDYETFDLCTYEWDGDVLRLDCRGTSDLSGEYVRIQPNKHPFLPEGLLTVMDFEDLGNSGAMELQASMTAYWEHEFLYLLRSGEILEQQKSEEPIRWTEYCYRAEVKNDTNRYDVIFADGWLHFDGEQYRLSTTEGLEQMFREMEWQPSGGYTDEWGLTYYHLQQEGKVNLSLHLRNGYRDHRVYVSENVKQWNDAFETARACAAVQEPDCLLTADQIGWLYGLDAEWQISVYSNGLLSYSKSVEEDAAGNSEWRTFYISPEDSPELQELLRPYLEMYQRTTYQPTDTMLSGNECDGSWRLVSESPDPELRYVTVAFDSEAALHSATTQQGAAAMQIGDTVYIKHFDFYMFDFDMYLQKGWLRIRWKDGTEEAFPCRLTDDRMIITAEEREWVFARSAWIDETLRDDADVIRLPRGYSGGQILYLDLSEEALGKLEKLLREGIGEEVENIILSDAYYYKLKGLEAAFSTNEITLSDYGTLHYGGKAYRMNNWDALHELLGSMFQIE